MSTGYLILYYKNSMIESYIRNFLMTKYISLNNAIGSNNLISKIKYYHHNYFCFINKEKNTVRCIIKLNKITNYEINLEIKSQQEVSLHDMKQANIFHSESEMIENFFNLDNNNNSKYIDNKINLLIKESNNLYYEFNCILLENSSDMGTFEKIKRYMKDQENIHNNEIQNNLRHNSFISNILNYQAAFRKKNQENSNNKGISNTNGNNINNDINKDGEDNKDITFCDMKYDKYYLYDELLIDKNDNDDNFFPKNQIDKYNELENKYKDISKISFEILKIPLSDLYNINEEINKNNSNSRNSSISKNNMKINESNNNNNYLSHKNQNSNNNSKDYDDFEKNKINPEPNNNNQRILVKNNNYNNNNPNNGSNININKNTNNLYVIKDDSGSIQENIEKNIYKNNNDNYIPNYKKDIGNSNINNNYIKNNNSNTINRDYSSNYKYYNSNNDNNTSKYNNRNNNNNGGNLKKNIERDSIQMRNAYNNSLNKNNLNNNRNDKISRNERMERNFSNNYNYNMSNNSSFNSDRGRNYSRSRDGRSPISSSNSMKSKMDSPPKKYDRYNERNDRNASYKISNNYYGNNNNINYYYNINNYYRPNSSNRWNDNNYHHQGGNYQRDNYQNKNDYYINNNYYNNYEGHYNRERRRGNQNNNY